MIKTSLKGYNVSDFSFANNLPSGTQIKLGNNYQFNVKYGKNDTCLGEMKVKVYDRDNEDKFFVSLTMKAIFAFSGEVDKETIHVECFKNLFPYVRAMITMFTANAGIPPIIIPEADIESQSIYRVDLGNANNNNK